MKDITTKSFCELLTNPENLYSAWHKFRNYSFKEGTWFDNIEIARFEANIEKELNSIAKDFSCSNYKLKPLKPIPFPKKADINPNDAIRQAFQISVRDQVAWISFINIIGPWLDANMLPWSYGNRLYRPVWIEEENGIPKVKIGWYRHSSGKLYGDFPTGWPRFRRHIFLTARKMGNVSNVKRPLEPREERLLKEEESLDEKHKIPYLKNNFWGQIESDAEKMLYWCSIDLKKFYPNISLDTLKKNLSEQNNLTKKARMFAKAIFYFADELLKFTLNLDGWDEKDLKNMGIRKGQKHFNGIPTGLAVAGFLSNMALFEVDQEVNKLVVNETSPFHGKIAHFRYVDDHVILSNDFHVLLEWIDGYKDILKKCKIGKGKSSLINYKKLRPKELEKIVKSNNKKALKNSDIPAECTFNPAYPTPIMTKTLELISDMKETDFLLLSEEQQEHFLQELQHLLLTEFPDEEIRRDTRMSFAASMLVRCAPRKIYNPENIVKLSRNHVYLEEKKEILEKQLKDLVEQSDSMANIKKKIEKIDLQITDIKKEIKEIENDYKQRTERDGLSVFHLLMKAVHEYPEKQRLWKHALNYYYLSGYGNLESFMTELQEIKKTNKLSYSYLKSLMMQLLAKYLLSCTKRLFYDYENINDEDKNLKFIKNIFKVSNFLTKEKTKYYFEQHSKELFQCALGTTLNIFQKNKQRLKNQNFLPELQDSVQNVNEIIDWYKDTDKWVNNTNYSLEDWAFWANSMVVNYSAQIKAPFCAHISYPAKSVPS